jgi:small-conductance mechanosensitive channel
MEGFESFLDTLNYALFSYGENTVRLVHVIAIPAGIVLGYLLTRWSTRLLVSRMDARQVNQNKIHFVRRAYHIFAAIVIGLTILALLNVPLTAFAFVSGGIAIGVGFGAQNIINNYISGWILMWEHPIRIGDFLEFAEMRGEVEAINARSTRIRRVDGVHMMIPNSHLLENTVVNWTLIDPLVRTVVRVGVSYGSSIDLVKQLMQQAAVEEAQVEDEPEPLVIFDDFGDSALEFDLYVWVETRVDRDLRIVRSDLRCRIDKLFREHGIVIAFPQQDVHLEGEVKLVGDPDKSSP